MSEAQISKFTMAYRIANISKYATQVKITDENVIKHYGMINISR